MKHPEANTDPNRMGLITRGDSVSSIQFVRQLKHSVEDVWRSIVEPAGRKPWFPELDLEPCLGGKAVVNFSGGDCPAPEDNPSDVFFCEVVGYEPMKLLEYRSQVEPNGLSSHGAAPEHHRFELKPTDGSCTLTFLANLPAAGQFDDEAKTIESRFSVACGWHYKLDALEWTLDKIPFEDEGYAGPVKVAFYLAYLKRDKAAATL